MKPHLEEDKENNKDHFSNLPDELILKILSNLKPTFLSGTIALLSKKFHRISRDATLWTDLVLDNNSNNNSSRNNNNSNSNNKRDSLLWVLEDRGSKMEKLTLGSGWENSAAAVAIKALSVCHKLSYLSLTINGGRSVLQKPLFLPPNCLTTLIISGEWHPRLLNWNLMNNLLRLQVSTLGGLDSRGLMEIGTNCKALLHFSCSNAKSLDDISVAAFLSTVKNRLVTLDLDRIGCKLSSVSFRVLGQCASLERLDLHEVVQHLGHGELGILAKLSKIKHFFVTCESTCARNRHLSSAIKRLPDLTFLDLSGFATFSSSSSGNLVDDRIMGTVAMNCPKLNYLDVSNCGMITDRGVRVVLEKCQWLTKLGLLRVKRVTPQGFKVSSLKCNLRLSLLAVSRSYLSDEELLGIGRMWPKLAVYDGLLSDVMYQREDFERDHFYPGQTDEESGRPWKGRTVLQEK